MLRMLFTVLGKKAVNHFKFSMCNRPLLTLNPIEKLKVAIQHLNRDWNH